MKVPWVCEHLYIILSLRVDPSVQVRLMRNGRHLLMEFSCSCMSDRVLMLLSIADS